MSIEGDGTIVVLLGARSFPKYPSLKGGDAFAHSAAGFAQYLENYFGKEWCTTHLCDLFDSEEEPAEQLRGLGDFCRDHAEAKQVILYYVGHGGFLKSREYYLALRNTQKNYEHLSGLEIKKLALTIDGQFPGKQVYLILDCCFAGEAMSSFQDAGELTNFIESKTFDAFPASGTSLLCASSKDEPAISEGTGARTMFTECVLDVLTRGVPDKGKMLSLQDVQGAVEVLVKQRFGLKAVRPEVHSPRQLGADLAKLPLFRNEAYVPPEPKSLPGGIVEALKSSIPAVRQSVIDPLAARG